MSSLEELRAERIKKLELLKERGINPYPASSGRTAEISEFIEKFGNLPKDAEVTVAGRIMALRKHGGSVFVDLFDGTDRVQGYLKEDVMDKEPFELFDQVVDIGDFIDITGTPTVTKRGEKTVLATGWKMLTKSLRPLPEKWAGLKDTEERLRRRYLDILLNEDVRDMVLKRGIFWNSIRSFMLERGFAEVDTPAIETTTGGADARPFETHHYALDMDVYMRISAGELWQKKLMVAGLPKVFELGRIFRNEGMDAEHLQDYTQMEFYWAYADYKMGMELVEELYKYVAEKTIGTTKFSVGEHEVDLNKKWEMYDYAETIKDKTGIDIESATLEEIESKLKELKVDYDRKGINKVRATDQLWKYCRKQITGPGFLINVPVSVEPLAKRNPDNTETVERFQPILAGSEVGKGYSELNDPIDQNDRFEEQQKMRDAGDDEAQMMDHDYVEALEYGMPPTCGFGVSERFFAFLIGKPIRETQIFPLMKPKD